MAGGRYTQPLFCVALLCGEGFLSRFRLSEAILQNNVRFIDLSSLNDDAYAQKLIEIHNEELRSGFRVMDYPLHRMKIIKSASTQKNTGVIVTYLNSLFDGWSTSVLL